MNDRLVLARQALAAAEQKAGLRAVSTHEAGAVAHDAYDVPDFLVDAFPRGLVCGTPMSLRGSQAGAALLAGIASQHGAWVAFLGVADVGWSLIDASGIARERFAYVPDIKVQGPQVVSAAVEGFDVVVVGDVALDRQEQRVLERRVRTRNCIFIALGRWWAPATQLECTFGGVRGISGGIGHIRHIDYELSSPDGVARLSYDQRGWSSRYGAVGETRAPAGLSVVPEAAS